VKADTSAICTCSASGESCPLNCDAEALLFMLTSAEFGEALAKPDTIEE